MIVKCECGCGGIIDYTPGNELYLPGHRPNPIKEIVTTTISLKNALGKKGFTPRKPIIRQDKFTRAMKKHIRYLSGHRCFLCGRFDTGHKKAFPVCAFDVRGQEIAVMLCDKCKTNKDRLNTAIINKFDKLGENNKCQINSVLVQCLQT